MRYTSVSWTCTRRLCVGWLDHHVAQQDWSKSDSVRLARAALGLMVTLWPGMPEITLNSIGLVAFWGYRKCDKDKVAHQTSESATFLNALHYNTVTAIWLTKYQLYWQERRLRHDTIHHLSNIVLHFYGPWCHDDSRITRQLGPGQFGLWGDSLASA